MSGNAHKIILEILNGLGEIRRRLYNVALKLMDTPLWQDEEIRRLLHDIDCMIADIIFQVSER